MNDLDAIYPFILFNQDKFDSCLVLSLPHAGTYLPQSFLDKVKLLPEELKIAEDAYTDEIFGAENLGVSQIKANYSRTFLDVNREPYELCQKMFKQELPAYVNHFSMRAAKGFGTIPFIVKRGMRIYNEKLNIDEVKERIAAVYHPYHNALAQMIKAKQRQFGEAFVLDCHSMPWERRTKNFDVVVSNNFGMACDRKMTDFVIEVLESLGFKVSLNKPFAGGYITCHYGCPELSVNALQIEIQKSLYMDEKTFVKNSSFAEIRQKMQQAIAMIKAKTNTKA